MKFFFFAIFFGFYPLLHLNASTPKSLTCTRTEYREEYIPGTKSKPGYVRNYEIDVKIPCHSEKAEQREDNDCTDGKIAGALLGGGAGAAMSRGDGRWWAVPLGAVLGSKIGCDAAGG